MPFSPEFYQARTLVNEITRKMVRAGYPVQTNGRERYRRDRVPVFYYDWSRREFNRSLRSLLLGAWTSRHARRKLKDVLRTMIAEHKHVERLQAAE